MSNTWDAVAHQSMARFPMFNPDLPYFGGTVGLPFGLPFLVSWCLIVFVLCGAWCVHWRSFAAFCWLAQVPADKAGQRGVYAGATWRQSSPGQALQSFENSPGRFLTFSRFRAWGTPRFFLNFRVHRANVQMPNMTLDTPSKQPGLWAPGGVG